MAVGSSSTTAGIHLPRLLTVLLLSQASCWGPKHFTTSISGGKLVQGPEPYSNLKYSRYHRPWITIRGGETDDEDEDTDDDTENDDDDEGEGDEVEVEEKKETPKSGPPIQVLIRTSMGNKIFDQSFELSVSPSRTIESLKDSIRRQLAGRPPVATMQLVLHGQRLSDDVFVHSLVEEDEDEDEDDEEEENSVALVLQLDMVPPVDPKFAPQLQQQLSHMTTAELLEAYATNEATLYQNSLSTMTRESPSATVEEDDEDESVADSDPASIPLVTDQIRQQADKIKETLEQNFLQSPKAQTILTNEVAPAEQSSLQATEIRGQRVRQVSVKGVTTSFRRRLQRQINVDWGSALWYSLLFLFFGYFGGRTSLSRSLLLLGAPAVFVLQARPVQRVIKQALYTALYHPPSIVLSLLPAPQQKIVALDIESELDVIYGDFIVRSNTTSDDSDESLLSVEVEGEEDDDEDVSDGDEDDDDEDDDDEDDDDEDDDADEDDESNDDEL